MREISLGSGGIPAVKVGQVWRDCDPRMGNQRIVVERIEGNYAICRNAVIPSMKTRIRLDRFRPNSTGFVLGVSDAKAKE